MQRSPYALYVTPIKSLHSRVHAFNGMPSNCYSWSAALLALLGPPTFWKWLSVAHSCPTPPLAVTGLMMYDTLYSPGAFAELELGAPHLLPARIQAVLKYSNAWGRPYSTMDVQVGRALACHPLL